MAIGTIQGSMYYDVNRDAYVGADYYRRQEQERFEREMHQRQMYAAQQQMNHNPFVVREGVLSGHAVTVQDPKDPLNFLSKADNKILLTGEAT